MATTTRLPAPAPLVGVSAAFVLAGGWVHLRAWLETYRHAPDALPGAFVVRLGFPVHALLALVAAVALLAALVRWRRGLLPTIAAVVAFQVLALASLVASRTTGLLGWMEQGWDRNASQSRALELGAIAVLLLAAALTTRRAR